MEIQISPSAQRSQWLLCNKKAKSVEENRLLRKWNTSIYTYAVIWDNQHSEKKILTSFSHLSHK